MSVPWNYIWHSGFNLNRAQKVEWSTAALYSSSSSSLPFVARMWRFPSGIKSPSFCLLSLHPANCKPVTVWLEGLAGVEQVSNVLDVFAIPLQVSNPADKKRRSYSVMHFTLTGYSADMWAVPNHSQSFYLTGCLSQISNVDMLTPYLPTQILNSS